MLSWLWALVAVVVLAVAAAEWLSHWRWERKINRTRQRLYRTRGGLMDACPRCTGPMHERPAMNSLSRTDSATYVCARCGTEEAMNQWQKDGWTEPVSEWPVRNFRQEC